MMSYHSWKNSGKVKLGRPWKQGAISVFYKCYMGDHIAVGEDRFADMGGSKKGERPFHGNEQP